MNTKKKIIAILLSVALVFVSSVTAFAADGDTYVDGFMNQDGQYCMRIGNFGMVNLVNYVSAQAPGDDTWNIRVRLWVGDNTVFHCSLDSNLNATVIPTKVDSENTFYDWDFSENAPLGARVYINDNQFSDTGIVIFFDNDSEYLYQIANADKVKIQTELENEDSSVYVTIGDPGIWYSLDADFRGLDDYKTAADTPADTTEPTVETEEVIAETEEIIDETEEIAAETEEIVIETEEIITADEETEEIIPETEDIAAETEEPAPAPETEENNQIITETPEETKPADTDTTKTNPNTGMASVAACSAAAILAFGAVTLSRKKK